MKGFPFLSLTCFFYGLTMAVSPPFGWWFYSLFGCFAVVGHGAIILSWVLWVRKDVNPFDALSELGDRLFPYKF